MITLIKNRSLHTPSNLVLGSLCCSDLLFGMSVLPFWIIVLSSNFVQLSNIDMDRLVKVVESLTVVFGAFSSQFIALVNLDRYAAVCHPFKYLKYATSSFYIKISVCMCLGSTLATSVALTIDMNVSSLITFILFATAAFVLTICNWKILKVIHSHRRAIASIAGNNNEQQLRHQNETKRYRIILLLVFLFILFKVPYISYYIYVKTVASENVYLDLIFGLITGMLWPLNSLVNPVVYCFRIKVFRDAAKELLCCK